MKTDLKAAPA